MVNNDIMKLFRNKANLDASIFFLDFFVIIAAAMYDYLVIASCYS